MQYVLLSVDPERDCSLPADSTLEDVIVYIDGLRYGRRVPGWYQSKLTQSVKSIPCTRIVQPPTMKMYLLIGSNRGWYFQV